MSVNSKMTAIADAIREKTGKTEKLSLDAMEEGIEDVYDAGFEAGQNGDGGSYDQGYTDGQKAEYDAFWDAFQENGNRQHYAFAFCHKGWSDKNYNPKYPIVPRNANGLMQAFQWNQGITDTKVPITAYENCSTAFGNSSIKRIPKLIFNGCTNVNNMFNSCTYLEEVYCEGELALSISFQHSSLLNDASIQSIIDCLSDLTGQSAQTITFHTGVLAKLTDDQIASILAKNWSM